PRRDARRDPHRKSRRRALRAEARRRDLGEAARELATAGRGRSATRRKLARPPGLVLVREPDELGIERPHPQLALGAWLVELAAANGDVAANDERTSARL